MAAASKKAGQSLKEFAGRSAKHFQAAKQKGRHDRLFAKTMESRKKAAWGVTHDFENRSSQRAGVLNFCPGVFEPAMEGIAEWFAKHPPGDAL